MLVVILSLAAGVLAGTPLHAPDDGMMECCKRAKSKDQTPKNEIARLCCAINCSTTSPAPSGGSFNPAPTSFTITKSIADQIADLFASSRPVAVRSNAYSRDVLPRTFQPSYIQLHQFLI